MPTVSFYDLLGVANDDAAAEKWPASRVQGDIGVVAFDEGTIALVHYLQDALRFHAVRPGAAPDRVGISAEVVVANPPNIRPLVLRQMPDIGFYLQNTVGLPGTAEYRPARLYVTTGETGTEVVIEGLPVEIRIPSGLLGPLREAAEDEAHPEGGPEVTLTEPFVSGVYDSVQITLRDSEEFSSIWCHVRVRMTEELDFIIEPAVPISIGACRFNGLPCHGLHDIAFVPSPRLHDDHPGEQALEWTRHSINPFARWLEYTEWAGALTVRTVDLNAFRPPLKDITDKLNEGRANNLKVEFVLQDVALPFFNLTGLPLPVHGEFGLRRPIIAGDDPAEAFNLSDPPRIALGSVRLIIEQLLLRTPASLDPLDQFVFAKLAVLLPDQTAAPESAATIGVTDDWTLQLGWRHATPFDLFTIADATVSLWGFKIGLSIGRWTSKTRYQWYELLQLLFDAQVTTKSTSLFKGAFKIQSLSGADVDIVVRDFGWNLGSFTLGGFSFPDGVQLIAFDVVRLIAEEVTWIAENNGATYFSMSGGIGIGAWEGTRPESDAETPGIGGETEQGDKGGGLRFHRLRFRTSGNPSAPAVLFDGASLSVRWGRFRIEGLGMLNEFSADGHDYKEFAFGLEAEFDATGRRFVVGLQLFFGRVKGPIHDFRYWLFGVRLGDVPIGSFELYNLRILGAGNLTPNLPPPDANAQEMRIFRWYKSSGDGAITLPSNRRLGPWRPVDESLAIGVGGRLSTAGTTTITGDLFFLGYMGPEGRGFLAALEVYFAKSTKPIGFAAIELDLDRDKWGILIGVALSVNNVLPEGVDPDFLRDILSVTGTLFIGNKPGTLALGQLNDQATWLTFRCGTTRRIEASMTVALCIQIVDAPNGPRGCGFSFVAKGGKKFGVGALQCYLTFGFMMGTWRNESMVSGFVAWIEMGFRIKVFWVFNFGASARIEFDYLGPAPAYKRFAVVLRIGTPWWLPDVTLRFEVIDGASQSARMRLISTPVIAAAALDPARQSEVPVLVTPLLGGMIDARAVYSTTQLAGLAEPALSEPAIEALAPVGVDSVIAVDFKPGVDDGLTIGENTPAGAGTQAATPPAHSDLSVTYELIEAGIRRRPRFGAGAGEWTTLLAPEDTTLETPADLPPDDELEAHFESVVSFVWDKNRVYQDRLDPRRLLVNALTPYTFVAQDPEADDVLVADQPGWPCCVPDRKKERWHVLDFSGTPFGTRAPASQRFSESSSTLHWMGRRRPVVAPGLAAPAGAHAARVSLAGRPPGRLATVSFDRPAFLLDIDVYWLSGAALGALVIEAYDGLAKVATHTLPFASASPPVPVRLQRLDGMTSVVFRTVGGIPGPAPVIAVTGASGSPGLGWLEVVRMRYRTVSEQLDRIAWDEKCRVQGDRAVNGGGRLAWLPNHDYEISLTTKVTLAHERSGAQEALVRQKTGFRTRGLPGLNAVARLGDELEPYVESRYPGPAPRTLYRAEPVALAFDERFNVLLPVDRAPSPDKPDELNQILEWVLAIERVGSAVGAERVSQTTPDWVVTHRPVPLGPRRRAPRIIDGALVHDVVRGATTRDPFRRRFEQLVHGPFGCGTPGPTLHRSQVLMHQPVDLGAATDAAQLWEPRNTYRVNVRRKLGPFVERDPFDPGDAPAFSFGVEGGGSFSPWTSADGVMRLAAPPADGVRRYAIFGDTDWNHVQVRVAVDPQGGAAGVAVAIAGLPTVSRAALAVVDEPAGVLRLLERLGGIVTELDSQPLPSGAEAPYALELIAFDDRLRASVGETVVEGARGEPREGRLALVAQDGGAFHSLRVESLDAYRFHFMSSSYATFEDHIGSFDGVVQTVPTDASTPVSALLATTAGDIAALMTPGADPLSRQALFDRWVSTLALPLRREPASLSLSRAMRDGKTELMVLEGPEPLPFAADVSLVVRHLKPPPPPVPPRPPRPDLWWDLISGFFTFLRAILGSPVRPRSVSPELKDIARDLHFAGGRVTGTFRSRLPSRARRVVRAVAAGDEIRYEVYDISLRPGRRGTQRLTGRLVRVVGPTEPPPVPGLRRGDIAIVDGVGVLVVPVIPVDPVTWIADPTLILTNAAETVALVIPTGATPAVHSPLASGTYEIELAVDRARFRAQVPDAVSNYRASVTVTVEL